MFENVARLAMYANSFSGSIPTEYGLLENLTRLELDTNVDIIGSVPTELIECKKLTFLTLYKTGISGSVSFCNSFGDDIDIRVSNVSMCGQECECCCTENIFSNRHK